MAPDEMSAGLEREVFRGFRMKKIGINLEISEKGVDSKIDIKGANLNQLGVAIAALESIKLNLIFCSGDKS